MTRTAPARSAARAPEIYRRRRLAAALVALLLLAGLGLVVRVLLYDSGLFTVRDVEVSGLTTINHDDVVSIAAVPDGAPLASVDLTAVAERVAALPAVALVHVDRSWPHTITVAVTERVPVATVPTPKGVQLVDAGGTVYPGAAPPGLPELTLGLVGPDDPITRSALGALTTLPPAVRSQVLTIDATAAGTNVPGQVTFGLTNNRRVVWGTDERAAEKAAVLVPLLTQPGHVFDVTSPDLPTIRR